MNDVMYGDLASWWPLISPVGEYRDEALYIRSVFEESAAPAPQTMLELGSGGGHIAHHLADRFDLTLVDLSPQMLEMSRLLVPSAEHLVGDMRAVRLGRQFDAVLIHDAIDYMTTEADLLRALKTSFEHLRPGGLAVFVPDVTTELFEPDHDTGGSDGTDGRSVRFLEWTVDPDPTDTMVTTDYVFLLRHPDGRMETVHETHRTGLFPRRTWLRLLSEAGFEATRVRETTDDDRTPRDLFVATRPAGAR